jgi:hypothetical protein
MILLAYYGEVLAGFSNWLSSPPQTNRNPPALKTYMGVISRDKEKILKNCQNELFLKIPSGFSTHENC